MNRYARRVDDNQAEIVQALRASGASVQHLYAVGHGCPDLLVARAGVNYLLEVKDCRKSPSERRLTPDEAAWHQAWNGSVMVVSSVDEALRAIGAIV